MVTIFLRIAFRSGLAKLSRLQYHGLSTVSVMTLLAWGAKARHE